MSGRHVLKADANSRSAQFVTLWGGKGEWRQAVGLVRIDSRLPDDTAVARVVSAWADSLRERLGPERRVGTAEVPIDARDAVSRRQESVLGDLVTDAARAGTGSDVALINAGAMRLDDVIPSGPVTMGPAWSGMRPTMPAKMMKLMPLPRPRSLMSSPSHMSRIVPAVKLMSRAAFSKLNRSDCGMTPFASSRTLKP